MFLNMEESVIRFVFEVSGGDVNVVIIYLLSMIDFWIKCNFDDGYRRVICDFI